MTISVPALLAAYALAAAAAGTWWLPRASWPRRLPRLGIAAWQVLTVTFVASVLLTAMLIAIPCLPDGVHLDAAAELRNHYSSARGIVIGSTAAVGSLAVIGSPASFDSLTASGDSFCSRAFCSGVAGASMRV